jgi:hypothetical protein
VPSAYSLCRPAAQGLPERLNRTARRPTRSLAAGTTVASRSVIRRRGAQSATAWAQQPAACSMECGPRRMWLDMAGMQAAAAGTMHVVGEPGQAVAHIQPGSSAGQLYHDVLQRNARRGQDVYHMAEQELCLREPRDQQEDVGRGAPLPRRKGVQQAQLPQLPSTSVPPSLRRLYLSSHLPGSVACRACVPVSCVCLRLDLSLLSAGRHLPLLRALLTTHARARDQTLDIGPPALVIAPYGP